MTFRVDSWVRHSTFGDGQVLEDRGDRVKVQFVTSGERLMLKQAMDPKGIAPPPGFTVGKQKRRTKVAVALAGAVPDGD